MRTQVLKKIMAISTSFLAHVLVIIMASAFFCVHASEFYVGGSDGWTQDPREDYNHRVERMRFNVNDSQGTSLFRKQKVMLGLLLTFN